LLKKDLRDIEKFFDVVWKTQAMNPMTVKLIHSQGFNEKRVKKDFIEIYMNRVAQLGPDLFLQLFGEMQRHDILGDAVKMKIPSLIVGGDKDNVIPYHLQILLQRAIPHSELYLIKDGSHVPQVDFPELVNERMQLFIKTHLN
jgi:non-heme chloroperoxidase